MVASALASRVPTRRRSSSGPEKAFCTVTCWSRAKPISSASGRSPTRRSASGSPVNGRWSGGTGVSWADLRRARDDRWNASPGRTPRPMTTPAPFADAVGTLAVRCGPLLDVETGETPPDRLVLVRDGRFEAVLGPDDGLPDGTSVVDLAGSPSCPGSSTSTATSWRCPDAAFPGRRRRAPRTRSLVRNARVTLEAGFTTVRDLGMFGAFVDARSRRDRCRRARGPADAVRGRIHHGALGRRRRRRAGPDISLPEELRFGVLTTPDEVASGSGG